MTEEEEYEIQLQEEEAERVSELKRELSADLNGLDGVNAFPYELERDILVQGPLSVILEWAHDWRSEIEELG